MIYNIGSLSIDHIYRVPHMVRPGEYLTSETLQRGPGGKGLNQSIALARAGATVTHIGCIGADGQC
jgi:ribokinase